MGRTIDLARRRLILEQAEHQLHLKGYHHTAMGDIAEACRMTKANLFHHFGSKEELALAVLDAKIADYRKRRVEPLCADGDPVEAVSRMFSEAGCFFRRIGCKAGCFIANIGLEMADVNEHFRKRVGLFFSQWSESLARCLAKAKREGRFDEALDPTACAETLLALYEGAVLLARTRRDAAVFARVGKLARRTLETHKTAHYNRRNATMGPKTPCGC
ncbi:MAG: TetR family transcriptional regulator C-terminal domain-containing protein [Elusimicrobia bacterium]|nr:TetR family transcriptional regulator C-terminal domain-containing protein [Elusimicrobiota bacterium]MDE2236401.1 TetR family transcriptional regulator C-terminal domain-containing protein [Elusimicrobiota bacterium]MDE2425136.1 TetR family transcriptional regulator C-terminal domain-containing protein [Elusimicrobiota bacterium]